MRLGIPFASVLFVALCGCATSGGDFVAVVSDGGAGDGNADVGPEAGTETCVHTDDCKAPDLCTGTNGVACVGGLCVPTGKPQNCDDGVACTDDLCDANKNACTHKPNDAACPNDSYCDPTSNCVQTLPCTGPSDTVCDRLNTNACDGTWACDGVKKYCVRAPKPCADRPNATTTCDPKGPTCTWKCTSTYVDLDGDLSVPSGQSSTGCECNATDPIDRPTLANVDGNCDGIVGNVTTAIFVDTVTGNDANAGTMASPKKTIQGGISAAAAANPTKDVYVSKGTYSEIVTLADGVSVFGGYDAAAKWARSSSNVTTIASPLSVGLTAQNLAKATEIQLLWITSSSANGVTGSGDGQSSYGVRIVNSNGGVTVRGCTITAGAGYNAAAGPNGAGGNAGGPGGAASGTAQGAQGAGCNGASGGLGGNGVSGATPGNGGGNGTQVGGGGTGAGGGSGGAAGTCSTTSSSNGSPAPGVNASGGPGNPGANGTAGPNFGSFDALGVYMPAPGGNGISTGTPGGGGGGGGSGGGSAHGTNLLCTNCSAISSGGGGGGGGGGCGGAVGQGGRGGGGSFAIAIVSSIVTVDATKMTTANGGAGGNGGNGGGGGGGGGGGNGAAGQSAGGGCSTRSGGAGANGSAGGPGGNGGGAAGGTGGPSVCVVYKGSSPTTQNTQCANGGAGSGGAPGTNGVSAAQTGTTGVVNALLSSP